MEHGKRPWFLLFGSVFLRAGSAEEILSLVSECELGWGDAIRGGCTHDGSSPAEWEGAEAVPPATPATVAEGEYATLGAVG
jgi:hypothetical protein